MTRILFRVAFFVLVILLAVVSAGFAYLFVALPRSSPLADTKVGVTPDRVARGRYLTHHVAACVACHGERDWSKYSGPLVPGTAGKGGAEFKDAFGALYASNITPAAIGSWSDGELMRAITEGVSKDGTPLFPLMPYDNYRTMAPDDLEAIVAYVRSLSPLPGEVPARTLNFPLNLIVRTLPQPAALEERPAATDQTRYGGYLTTLASCGHCHSPMDDNGQPVEGMAFAGGTRFVMQTGAVVHAANITPDPETGIGRWSEAQFVNRFKMYERMSDEDLTALASRNTEMPWRSYAGMSHDDLTAIYAFLRSLPPVRNVVPRSQAALTDQ